MENMDIIILRVISVVLAIVCSILFMCVFRFRQILRDRDAEWEKLINQIEEDYQNLCNKIIDDWKNMVDKMNTEWSNHSDSITETWRSFIQENLKVTLEEKDD